MDGSVPIVECTYLITLAKVWACGFRLKLYKMGELVSQKLYVAIIYGSA